MSRIGGKAGTAPDALPKVTKMPRRASESSEMSTCGGGGAAAGRRGGGEVAVGRRGGGGAAGRRWGGGAERGLVRRRRGADAVDDSLDALAVGHLHHLADDVDRGVVLVRRA